MWQRSWKRKFSRPAFLAACSQAFSTAAGSAPPRLGKPGWCRSCGRREFAEDLQGGIEQREGASVAVLGVLQPDQQPLEVDRFPPEAKELASPRSGESAGRTSG